MGVASDDAAAVVDVHLASAQLVEDCFALPVGGLEAGPVSGRDVDVVEVGADHETVLGGEDRSELVDEHA